MQQTTVTINNTDHIKITADTGKVFRRIHDQMLFGSEIILGKDFSTGIERDDLVAYYEEIDNPTPTLKELEIIEENLETEIDTLENG